MKGLQALLVAFACAGCAQVPPLAPPAVPVPERYKEAVSQAPELITDSARTAAAWWTIFGDAELDMLERRLADNSPDLAGALARYQQARAATDVLRAGQSPRLGVNAGVQRPCLRRRRIPPRQWHGRCRGAMQAAA